ncbi:hypothetical protein PF008_g16904 [Phytophthora fragariae]|uniref:Uncharacterized protein n=1 Tax=Phytophthora fragariae TaxID=53985 RepID=A0A6G0RAZ5_9STRA|nr:hypothetical protein PF008_g16904 [Phytophthora fragariae]
MFGASPAEKKQRMDEVGLDEDADDEVASLDDAWDDREVADDAAFSLVEGSELSAEEKKPASDMCEQQRVTEATPKLPEGSLSA